MLIPESRAPRSSRIDLVGTALVTTGLTAIVLPLVEGRQHGWPTWTWLSLAAAPVILAAFIAGLVFTILAGSYLVGIGGTVAVLVPGLLLIGAGMGLGISPLAAIIMSASAPEHFVAASGALTTMQAMAALSRLLPAPGSTLMSTDTLVYMNDLRIGTMLRDWCRRRRLSQLDLALEAGISTRHLSFVETRPVEAESGDSRSPGRAARNPRYALGRVLAGHEPYPAIAVDRMRNLIASNAALDPLLSGVAPDLLQPPVTTLRPAPHPEGMTPRILNLRGWRAHLLHRRKRQLAGTGERGLQALGAAVAVG